MDKKTELTAQELYNLTDKWVNQFNFIQMPVVEKMAEGQLFKYIRKPEPDWEEFLNNHALHDEYEEYCKENELEEDTDSLEGFCNEEVQNQFQSFQDDARDSNYPMWDTLFEFKHNPGEEVIQSAIDAGFGIIEGMDDFKTMLFIAGCGCSFYGAHWIPLFISLPWNEDIKKEVERLGIGYDNL